MQTFLPYPDFRATAQALDRRRLGKQRVETFQILNALAGKTRGWVNHPATRMWRNFEPTLVRYGLAICDEWLERGYQDNLRQRITDYADCFPNAWDCEPWWLGWQPMHQSHRSNLYQKAPDDYPDFRWEPVLAYIWPKESPEKPPHLREAGLVSQTLHLTQLLNTPTPTQQQR